VALHTETASLERVVKLRASQLRSEGRGYLQAVRTIVDELYGGVEGHDTPIMALGAIAKVPWADILSLLRELLKRWFSSSDRIREEKSELEALVSPWVSAVYEQTAA
jgi:hypothetical protein